MLSEFALKSPWAAILFLASTSASACALAAGLIAVAITAAAPAPAAAIEPAATDFEARLPPSSGTLAAKPALAGWAAIASR